MRRRRPSKGPARSLGVGLLVLGVTGCAAPPATSDPAAFPRDSAIVWDITGSTDEGGRGPYFDGPNAPRLVAGAVLVSWWCEGAGNLSVVPGHVSHSGQLPAPQSPLAFQVICPTGGARYADWRRLPIPALGGENVVIIRPVASPSAVISYRFLFAQQAP